MAKHIKKELKNIADKIAKDTIKVITEKAALIIEQKYEQCIRNFYDDYNEKYYDRTYSSYYGSNGYSDYDDFNYDKVITKYTDYYKIKFNMSGKNIPGEPYFKYNGDVADKEWIFARTFNIGTHGYKGKVPIHGYTNYQPIEEFKKWFETFKKNKDGHLDKLKNEALKEAIKMSVKE